MRKEADCTHDDQCSTQNRGGAWFLFFFFFFFVEAQVEVVAIWIAEKFDPMRNY